MSLPAPSITSTDNNAVVDRKLKRRDLTHPQLRAHFWDQIHPRTGRFRPTYYQSSEPWQILSETLIAEPSFLNWVAGTYYIDTKIVDGDGNEEGCPIFIVRLGLEVDFRKDEECVQWMIDTRAPHSQKQAAYSGIHRGYFNISNLGGFNCFSRMKWQTIILSPYTKIETPYRGCDKEDFGAINMTSNPMGWSSDIYGVAGHREKVVFADSGEISVVVLQVVLKDLARLLVFGPRYSDMQLAPGPKYEEVNHAYKRSGETERLYESAEFPDVAAFFSRAFCQAGISREQELPVPEGYCLKTITVIEGLFELYKIIQEPRWVTASRQDWVDNLREEGKAVRTIGEWRKFETRWATITSYACGLNLHEGPWAGEDWREYLE
ncbi:hypothetical protein BGZ60DRAFT_529540 [Tricladium varicosporioides]|nr:hypothetical protein BGZ60DRAFT_529540 [Hymenoscyphus varicosporioides]